MKSLLLLLALALGISNTNAQDSHNLCDTIKGKLASYYRIEFLPKIMVKVQNIQNKDTLSEMYYDNGKIVSPDLWLNSEYNFDYDDYIQTFKDIFTTQELQQLKNMNGTFVTNVVADKSGNALEVYFVFSKKNSILMKLDPDRFFQLETKLKKLLKLKIQGDDLKIRNVKYMAVITFKQDL